MAWINNFTERQQKEIEFCKVYASRDFQHGTDGHNARMIIAQFADMMDKIEKDFYLVDSGGRLGGIEEILNEPSSNP